MCQPDTRTAALAFSRRSPFLLFVEPPCPAMQRDPGKREKPTEEERERERERVLSLKKGKFTKKNYGETRNLLYTQTRTRACETSYVRAGVSESWCEISGGAVRKNERKCLDKRESYD